jgi:formylglycine-generating enzyme required for sulfatase activity
MGTNNRLYGEAPIHAVKFRRGFLLGKYPVTQAQWSVVMGDNPSTFRDSPNLPVDGVSWDRASEFCQRISRHSGRNVRLPSEAEWEYACRAGTDSEFFFGPWGPFTDDTEVPWAACKALSDYAWFDLNSTERTWPVDLKRANPWGLSDIVGNVWEWCADVWHDDYNGAPDDDVAWVADAAQQPRRCLRGGAWDMNAFRCRTSYRSFDHRELATDRFGLRVAMDVS